MILNPLNKSYLSDLELNTAVNLLKNGEIIAIPTETVYGLACDIRNKNALEKLYLLKKRGSSLPISIAINNQEKIKNLIKIPTQIKELIEIYWPGPLTVILEIEDKFIENHLICLKSNSIAFRCPSNCIAQQIISQFPLGLFLTSANISNFISPISCAQVKSTFNKKIPLIINGGNCTVGVESTIISYKNESIYINRYGAIDLNTDNKDLRWKQCLSNKKYYYGPKNNILDKLSNPSFKNMKICLFTFDEYFYKNYDIDVNINPKNPILAAKNLQLNLLSINKKKYDLIIFELPINNINWMPYYSVISKIFKTDLL